MKNLPGNEYVENAILRAIDEGRDIQEVIDWQLACQGIPMQEPFTTEEMTTPKLQKALGLKKQELRLLHLVDDVHGEGLYSKRIAQREHIKAATVRQRIHRAKKKMIKRLTDPIP